MITFHLHSRSGVPPYLQIVQQVKQALRMGILLEGDQLPTVKEVVGMVAINPNTVFKAYHELENDGLVEGRTGSGTFVLGRPDGPPPSVQATLGQDLATWAKKALAAGLDDESIEALVRSMLHNIKEGTHES
jgi:GntR family transcriptional regulator